MPARNYSGRTREEYASDLGDLTTFLESRKLASWLVVGLRDLQLYMAELDRRGLSEEEYLAAYNLLDFGQQRLAWTAETSPAHLDK